MRALTMSIAIAVIIGACAALTGAAYWVGLLVEQHWFTGAARLTNIAFLMVGFVMVTAAFLTIAERKWSAIIQDRVGPNRARFELGPLKRRPLGGTPHIIADALKVMFKEDFKPLGANRMLYAIAPVLSFATVFALFAVVPAGPTLERDGVQVPMVIATPDFGLLYVFAIGSLAVYATSLGGWASNNKLALLGGVRASSQMISYEVALGLSLVGLMLCFGSVQLPQLVESQTGFLWKTDTAFDFGLPRWGFFLQPVGFVLFFAAAFAESKRAPFDLPEGESEIIGYFVEYSGMKFAVFMLSEFVEVIVLSGILASLFFGGWHLPFGEQWLKTWFEGSPMWWAVLLGTVFWVKVLLLVWLQFMLRWTFPRFRYDQIQNLGWKILLPIGLANVFVCGALVLADPTLQWLATLGLAEIILVVALTVRGPAPEVAHEAHAAPAHGAAAVAHLPVHGTAGTADEAVRAAAHH